MYIFTFYGIIFFIFHVSPDAWAVHQPLGVALTADTDRASFSLEMENEMSLILKCLHSHLGTDGVLIVMLTLLRVDTLPIKFGG